MLRRGRGKTGVDDCEWCSPLRHHGKFKGREVIRCGRYVPVEVQRVDEEGIVLWPRMIIVLNEGKLSSSKTAKAVNSSRCVCSEHILKGLRVRNFEG